MMPSATKGDLLLFKCCRVILELTCSRKSGLESIYGEIHFSALLRGEVFLDLVTFGHDKGCIAYCPDPSIVLEFLNFMLSDEVQNQDIIFMLSSISSESREVAWRWLKVVMVVVME